MLQKELAILNKQTGGLTIFTGILVLLLMTLMLLYAARVGVFEQRVSSNEARQKIAFHNAESAVDQGAEYMLANSVRIFSSSAEAVAYEFPAKTTAYHKGWLMNDGVTPGWYPCIQAMVDAPDHPCGGDIPATTTSYFYDNPATTAGDVSGADSLPLNVTGVDSTARLTALLCLIDIDSPSGGCVGAPTDPDDEKNVSAVMHLMGYGFSDCTNIADVSTCNGEARVARPLANYKNLKGSPSVPLTTKSIFPPNGTAEIVGNPNGGGLGVPLTAWINDNPACSGLVNIESSGSWQTCELQDWYHTDSYPEGVTCTDNNCFCGPGGNDTSFFLSWNKADTFVGIDIVIDDTFPCDLFEYYFGVPRNFYHIIKATATVISDCSNLGPFSSGFYWVSGPTCNIGGNGAVGSPTNPILLVSAASETKLAGGAEIYGILYVFDGEDINAEVNSLGNTTVYGGVIVDAVMGHFQGNFQIVWAEGVLASANGLNGVGSVSG
ncbi:MAG: hypothetical protein ACI9H8_001694, partial [Lysobacterales bacterium]